MIENRIKILILEDHQTDLELIKRQVLKAAPNAILTVTSKKKEFEEKLSWLTPDIILSDYRLIDFNGLDALFYVKERNPEIPFVFITGTLKNEEEVANAVLHGASGYILKDNLAPLPKKLIEIYQASLQKSQDKRQLQEKRQDSMLKLNKAHELIQKSDIKDKAQITSLLQEVRESLEAL